MSNNTALLPPVLEKLVQKLKRQSDPKRRYELLIWLAQKLEPIADQLKVPDNRVPGCTSQVFISARLEDGKIYYTGDADAQIVKGLVTLLVQGLSGLPSQDILAVDPAFIQDSGLNISLSPSRANGFYNILQMMKQKAALLDQAADLAS